MNADAARPDLDALLAEAGWVRALAHSLVSDPATADDVVQETWMAVLRRPPRTDAPVRPWLKRVVENFARMRRRGEAARATREEQSAKTEALVSPDELVARIETQRLLAQEVLHLDEPFRSTVVLRYYEGLSAADIARRTRAPAGTVRWRLMRGLELLRERLDQRHRGDRTAWVALLMPLSIDKAAWTSISVGGTLSIVRWVAALAALLVAVVWWRASSADVERATLARPAEAVAVDTDDVRTGGSENVREEVAANHAAASEPAPATRYVSARIVDRARRPIAGARLALADGSRSGSPAGEDGVAALTLPLDELDPASRTAFEARADGFVAKRVEARLAADTVFGEIELAAAGVIEGRVVDADGRPLARARVQAVLAGSVRNWRGKDRQRYEEARFLEALFKNAPSTTTDADGRFRFGALPESYLRLRVAHGVMANWSDDVGVLGGQTVQVPTLQLDLPPAEKRIAGIVLDARRQPVPFAEIECARESVGAAFFRGEPWVIRLSADEQGRFDFAVTRQWNRNDLAARDREQGSSARVTAVAPGTRDVELVLGPPRRVEIVARDEAGQPIDDPRVEFIEADHGRELTIESASFALGFAIAPGVQFLARVSAPGFAGVELGPYEPAKAPAKLECTLRRAGSLVCVVVDPSGAPVEGARAELWPEANGLRSANDTVAWGEEPFCVRFAGSARPLQTSTDAQGRCGFEVPHAGRWVARIWSDGFAPAVIGPFELVPDRSRNEQVELSQGGALAGRVKRYDGRAVAGTVVGVSCGDGWVSTQRVGDDGAFHFDRLTPGHWQVREAASEAEFAPWSRLEWSSLNTPQETATWNVDVRAGELAQFELALGVREPRRLSGRLLLDGAAPGPWEIEARLDRAGRPSRGMLDPFGRFELSLPRAGRYELQLFWSMPSGAILEVKDQLDVAQSEVDWSHDLATARLSVRLEPPADDKPLPETVRVRWRGPGELEFVADAELRPDHRVDIGRWPAGRSTIEFEGEGAAAWKPLPIDLAAGETREFTATRGE